MQTLGFALGQSSCGAVFEETPCPGEGDADRVGGPVQGGGDFLREGRWIAIAEFHDVAGGGGELIEAGGKGLLPCEPVVPLTGGPFAEGCRGDEFHHIRIERPGLAPPALEVL